MTKQISIAVSLLVVACTSSRSPPPSKGNGTTSSSTPAVSTAPGANVKGNSSAPTGLSKSSKGFRWTGTVAAGKWVWLRNLNGSITVEGTSNTEMEVTARVHGNAATSTPTIKVVPHNGTVTVCVLWPGGNHTCGPNGNYSHSGSQRGDVSVELVVKLPKGVAVDASTVNGSVAVKALAAAVKARSVNGSLTIATSGHADVKSVNGAIDVSIGRGPLSASTVNGSIRARVPAGMPQGKLDLNTVNGRVSVVN